MTRPPRPAYASAPRCLRRWLACALLGALAGLELQAEARPRERSNEELPPRYRRSPYALMSLSVGLPNDGWQLRAKKLRASDDLWIQGKSVPNSYGHPALVLMLYRTAKQISRQSPGSVLLVGDLS